MFTQTNPESRIPNHAELIKGGLFQDHRGKLMHCNAFNPEKEGVQRFYLTENADTDIVRAWQGHRVETKWFCVISGTFLVGLVVIDDWDQPSPGLVPERLILSAEKPAVLRIPPGYANGFRALQPGSKMLIFSDTPIEEAEKIVFPSTLWMNWKEEC